MSTETTFINIKNVTVRPLKTVRHENPAIGLYSTQRLSIELEGGGKYNQVLFLESGMHALAVGEVVTNEQVTV
jgi:hypothetical protein